ncbi:MULTISPECIES: glycosyltransferase family 2 protein [unclassified Pseudoalteromonas]|uniref:glycosyltransferase family 2 protein n=1 Tax=unclassified Pseudoalteromonas TaxID=194690 RepID=UPI0033259AE2
MENEKFDLDAFRAQPLPTEEEVMANWQGDIDKPVVSILCHMFNQERYIEDAFRGFLMQKTDFVFEVIAHDDASTDGTSDIVREYAKRYPKIFKPVIQTENQYSKGKKPSLLSSAHAKGEYFALCEGDDFWINENKLQLQTDVLNNNRKVNLVVHDSLVINNQDDLIKDAFGSLNFNDGIVPVNEVFLTDGQFAPTASYFFRNVSLQFLADYSESPVGDFLIEVFLGMEGVFLISNKMSVYRLGSDNSWTNNVLNNINMRIVHGEKMLATLNKMQNDLPQDKKYLVEYKRKAIFHGLAISHFHKSKLDSLLFFSKSLDFKNLKIKRAILYFRYVAINK